MRLPTSKPESCCSKEVVRYALTAVKLDGKRRRMIASDGKILCVVPVEPAGEDENLPDALIDPETLKQARKAKAGKAQGPTLERTEKGWRDADSREYPDSHYDSEAFPNSDAVVPEPGDRPPDIVLDPRNVQKMAEALLPGKDKAIPGLAFWFEKDKKGQIKAGHVVYVRPTKGDGYGVIMPMTLDKVRPVKK